MPLDRRLDVLRAIVEDYVRTREPVGSKALVDRHNLGVSSATIRNDMAALEEDGLISAPHTSAGRIPTDMGYRLFVDQISQVKPLSGPERKAIERFLEQSADLDDAMERTARLLSQLTQQVAVVQYPLLSQSTVRHIELVPLGDVQCMLVLIMDSSRVEQRVIEFDQPLSEESVAALRTAINVHTSGKTMRQAQEELVVLGGTMNTAERSALNRVNTVLKQVIVDSQEHRVVLAGTANLVRSTGDFPHSIGPVLEALEEQVVLLRLLTEMAQDAHGVSISIGRENEHESLLDTSVIATTYGADVGDKGETAKIGVIGPTRMDYPSTISSVRAVARYLARILQAN